MAYLLINLLAAIISTSVVMLGQELFLQVSVRFNSDVLSALYFLFYILASMVVNYVLMTLILKLAKLSHDPAYDLSGGSRVLFSWAFSSVLFFVIVWMGTGCIGTKKSKQILIKGIRTVNTIAEIDPAERSLIIVQDARYRKESALRSSYSMNQKGGGTTKIRQILVPITAGDMSSKSALFAYSTESNEKNFFNTIEQSPHVSGFMIQDSDSRCFSMLEGFDFAKANLQHIERKLCFDAVDSRPETLNDLHQRAYLYTLWAGLCHFICMMLFVGLRKPKQS